MRIQAVFFDLFETLITEFMDGSRISKRQYDYMQLLGLSAETFKHEWRNHQDARMRGEHATFNDVIRAILASHSLPVNEANIEFLYQERLKEKHIPFRQIHAEVLELLQYLKQNQIKVGLISNCTEEEVRGWQDCALSEYFDDAVFSYQTGKCKPDKEIYTLACERLQVLPEASVFVGDGGSNELSGAADAGLNVFHAVWFQSWTKSDFKQLRRPSELIAAFQ
ncbi:HAD family hydrolase [Paenibacillus sp. PR3]|uniref:HAD family hydrolase n=1 Tax=Paenibacillus terricola TaxID=2763503 RepID=A0ABR8N2P8_9BACL|nr:HAD family hydrolase [Paenibacillus terricola]MBD3922150.1 HAD family hydrolase [Paenibacillus terricola]